VKRPLSDFLNAQGQSGSIYFPTVPDYVGWFSTGFVTFGLVDYAGLANKWLEENHEISLDTESSGRVLDCASDVEGRRTISVVLNTRKALGFAQDLAEIIDNSPNFPDEINFLGTDTIFGNKAQDVATGANPAVGPASLHTTFTIDQGGDLPDFLDVINDPATYAPVTVDFRSTTVGTLPDGTRARLRVQQVGATDENGELVYTREIVDLNK
jgi:hypothetical protein